MGNLDSPQFHTLRYTLWSELWLGSSSGFASCGVQIQLYHLSVVGLV